MMSDEGQYDSEVEFDEHQKQVNESVDDGGGCTETWGALSEMRSDDEPSGNRRRMLKTMATAMVGFGFASGSASADSGRRSSSKDNSGRSRGRSSKDDPRFEAHKVTSQRERAKVEKRSFNDGEVKKIRQEFHAMGWESQRENVRISKLVDDKGKVQQYTTAIPFDTDHGVASIIWTDDPDIGVKGLRNPVADGSKMVFENYVVRKGKVVEEQNVVTQQEIEEAMPEGQVTTQGSGSFPNCKWNTSCVGTLAALGASTFACCATCSSAIGAAATGLQSCVCCVGAAIGFVSVDCNVCEN